jgi:bifunctional DNA-binding transcriptional regulator/antitoxin component of YhaV-PrlF toxin-antitoxin module
MSNTTSVIVDRSCAMKPAVAKIAAKFQLTVPVEVRNLYDLREGDLLEWKFDEASGQLMVEPKRAALLSPVLDQRVAAAKRRREDRKRSLKAHNAA